MSEQKTAGPLTLIGIATKNTERLIVGHRGDGSNMFARGLASEGYDGGYLDALRDVLAVLRKTPPSCRPERWEQRASAEEVPE